MKKISVKKAVKPAAKKLSAKMCGGKKCCKKK